MAYPIASGDQLAEIAWSHQTHVETQRENFFSKAGLTAKDTGGEDAHMRRPGMPIVIKDELKSRAGEEIRMRMRKQLTRTARTSSYTYGTTSMIDNEEALSFLDVSVFLSLLKNSVAHDTPDFNSHRTSLDMEEETEDALREWLVENHEESILDAFYDGHPYQTIAMSLASAVTHPRSYYAGGAANAGDMDSTKVLTANEIRRMKSYVKNRKLNPVKYKGKSCYFVLADTFTCNDLLGDSEFANAQSQGNTRGDDNPMIAGAIGHYFDFYVHPYERVRVATSGANASNIARLPVLGADAIAVVYGSEPRLVQRAESAYGDKWGLAIRQVFGARRCEFQSQDNATTVQQSSVQWNVWKEVEDFAV